MEVIVLSLFKAIFYDFTGDTTVIGLCLHCQHVCRLGANYQNPLRRNFQNDEDRVGALGKSNAS